MKYLISVEPLIMLGLEGGDTLISGSGLFVQVSAVCVCVGQNLNEITSERMHTFSQGDF